MPATMVRSSVPTSMRSCISFLDLGTRSADRTLATRSSTLMNWSMPMRVSAAAGGRRAVGLRRRRGRRDGLGCGCRRRCRRCGWVGHGHHSCRGCRGATAIQPRPDGGSLHQRSRERCLPRGVTVERDRVGRRRFAGSSQNLRGRRRHHRQQEHRGNPQRLGGVAQHLSQRLGPGGVLGQRPRFRCRDERVGCIDDREGRKRRLVQGETLHRVAISPDGLLGHNAQPTGLERGRRQRQPAVLLHHGRDPAHQVAQVVGQVDVVALLETLPREVAVAAVRDLLHQVQPQRIGAEMVGRVERVDHGAERLAHLLALEVHPAVPEDRGRQRQPRAHQHRRPHDAVEPRDVLADDVQAGRPPSARTARRRCRSPRPRRS